MPAILPRSGILRLRTRCALALADYHASLILMPENLNFKKREDVNNWFEDAKWKLQREHDKKLEGDIEKLKWQKRRKLSELWGVTPGPFKRGDIIQAAIGKDSGDQSKDRLITILITGQKLDTAYWHPDRYIYSGLRFRSGHLTGQLGSVFSDDTTAKKIGNASQITVPL